MNTKSFLKQTTLLIWFGLTMLHSAENQKNVTVNISYTTVNGITGKKEISTTQENLPLSTSLQEIQKIYEKLQNSKINDLKERKIYVDRGKGFLHKRYVRIDNTIQDAIKNANLKLNGELNLVLDKKIITQKKGGGQTHMLVEPFIETIRELKEKMLNNNDNDFKNKTIAVKKQTFQNGMLPRYSTEENQKVEESDFFQIDISPAKDTFTLELMGTGIKVPVNNVDLEYYHGNHLYSIIKMQLQDLHDNNNDDNDNDKKLQDLGVAPLKGDDMNAKIKKYIKNMEKQKGFFLSNYDSSKGGIYHVKNNMILGKAIKNNQLFSIFTPHRVSVTYLTTKNMAGSFSSKSVTIYQPFVSVNDILKEVGVLYPENLRKTSNLPKGKPVGFMIQDNKVYQYKEHPISKKVIPVLNTPNKLGYGFSVVMFSFTIQLNQNKQVRITELNNTSSLDDLNAYLEENKYDVNQIVVGQKSYPIKGDQTLEKIGIENGKSYILKKEEFKLNVVFPGHKFALPANLGIKEKSTIKELYNALNRVWGTKNMQGPMPQSIFVGEKKFTSKIDSTLADENIVHRSTLTVYQPWKLEFIKGDQKEIIHIERDDVTFESLQEQSQNELIQGKFILMDEAKHIISSTENLKVALKGGKKLNLYDQPIFIFEYKSDNKCYIIDGLNKDSTMKELTIKIGKAIGALNQGINIIRIDQESNLAFTVNEIGDSPIVDLLYLPGKIKDKDNIQVEKYQFSVKIQHENPQRTIRIDQLHPYQTVSDLLRKLNIQSNKYISINNIICAKDKFSTRFLKNHFSIETNSTIKLFKSYDFQVTDSRNKNKPKKNVTVTKYVTTFEDLREFITDSLHSSNYLIKLNNKIVKNQDKIPDNLQNSELEIISAIILPVTWIGKAGTKEQLVLNNISPLDTFKNIIKKIEKEKNELQGKLKKANLVFTGKNNSRHVVSNDLTTENKTLESLDIGNEGMKLELELDPIDITFEWKSSKNKEEKKRIKRVNTESTLGAIVNRYINTDKNGDKNSIAFEYQSKDGDVKRVGLNTKVKDISIKQGTNIKILKDSFDLIFKWYKQNGQEEHKKIKYLTGNTHWSYLQKAISCIADLQNKKWGISWQKNGKKVYANLLGQDNKTLKELGIPKQNISITINPFSLTFNWEDPTLNPILRTKTINTDEYDKLGMLLSSLGLPHKIEKNSLAFFPQKANKKPFLYSGPEDNLKLLGITESNTIDIIPNSFKVTVEWDKNNITENKEVNNLTLSSTLKDLWEKVESDSALKGKGIYFIIEKGDEEERFLIENNLNKSLQELGVINSNGSDTLKVVTDPLEVTLKWIENTDEKKLLLKGLDSNATVSYLFKKLRKKEYLKNREIVLRFNDIVLKDSEEGKVLQDLGIRNGSVIDVDLSTFTLKATWKEDEVEDEVEVSGLKKTDKLKDLLIKIGGKGVNLGQKNIELSWEKNGQKFNCSIVDVMNSPNITLEDLGLTTTQTVKLKKGRLVFSLEYKGNKELFHIIKPKLFSPNTTLEKVTQYLLKECDQVPQGSIKKLIYRWEKDGKKEEIKYKGNEKKTLKELGIDETVLALKSSLDVKSKFYYFLVVAMIIITGAIVVMRKQIAQLLFPNTKSEGKKASYSSSKRKMPYRKF